MYQSNFCRVLFLVSTLSFLWVFTQCQPKSVVNNDAPFLTFAQTLADSLDSGNAEFFNQFFDVDSLTNGILENIHGPKITKEGFKKGVTDNLDVGENILGAMGIDGHCKLLRVTVDQDSIPKALYRMVSQGGVNYFELYLQKNTQDTIEIIDYYPYAVGQRFSNTLRRIYLSSLSDLRDSIKTDSLSREDSIYVANIPVLDQIGSLFEKNEFGKALALIDSFPPAFQEDKMIQISKLNIAFNEGGETYLQTEEEFKKRYPKDPIVEVILLDFAFAKQEHTQALAIIDSLNKKIGGDTYLKVMKATIYADLEKYDTAISLLKEAIESEASMEEPYWQIIALYMEQKKYEEVVALFPQMQELFDINPAEFLVYDGYNSFWESEAYNSWAVQHPIDSVKLNLQ